MPEILTDLSVPSVIRANEENIYAFTPFSHGWKRAEVYKRPEINWVITGVRVPTCNVAFHAYLKPDNVDKVIEKFTGEGRKRKLPLQWYIGHDNTPMNLGEKLAAHGFTNRGLGPGMAIDLNAMNEDVKPPAGLKIIEVEDDKSLEAWCHVACTGFGIPPQAEPAMMEWFKTDLEYQLPLKLYLGIIDGKPAATSMYYLAAGVAGIYFVAVMPEVRRKGTGFAITQRPLKEAKKLGYRIGTLQASKMGEPVYLKMGFKEYFRTGSFVWMPVKEKEEDKKNQNGRDII
jgi:GNAT superfamily N-acetyltransferase